MFLPDKKITLLKLSLYFLTQRVGWAAWATIFFPPWAGCEQYIPPIYQRSSLLLIVFIMYVGLCLIPPEKV